MPLLIFRKASEKISEDELGLWLPCWKCGHQFPRDERACPICGSKRGKHR
jgi:rubrerythrin